MSGRENYISWDHPHNLILNRKHFSDRLELTPDDTYLVHCGNRVSSFSRIFSSLSTGWGRGVSVEALIPPKPGGGGMEAAGGMCGP